MGQKKHISHHLQTNYFIWRHFSIVRSFYNLNVSFKALGYPFYSGVNKQAKPCLSFLRSYRVCGGSLFKCAGLKERKKNKYRLNMCTQCYLIFESNNTGVSYFNDAFFTKYFVIILIFVVLQNLPNNNICNSFLSSSKLFHFLLCVRVLALSSCKQPYDASSKQSDVAWCDGSLTASLRDMSNNKFYFSHKEKKANLFLSKPKGYILYFWNTS